jgi:predicted secreted protein
MAKSLGNTHRLWVESTTPGTYHEVKGQTTLSISRQGNQIDTTTKDDGAYGTSMSGTKALTITAGFIPDLPDANGIVRLFTLAVANPSAPFNVQIRDTASAIKFLGSVNAINFDETADLNSPRGVSITLGAAAAPTTDLLVGV